MTRFGLIAGVVTAALVTAAPAGAQVYKLSANDGTVHFTNAPTDPRYRSLAGYSSGTATGWLRLQRADTERYGSEIKDASDRYGVPERLVHAVIRVESAFNPRAVSVKGAPGPHAATGGAGRFARVPQQLRSAAEHRRRCPAPAGADRPLRKRPAPGTRGLQRR